jgi:hypothetical protein
MKDLYDAEQEGRVWHINLVHYLTAVPGVVQIESDKRVLVLRDPQSPTGVSALITICIDDRMLKPSHLELITLLKAKRY